MHDFLVVYFWCLVITCYIAARIWWPWFKEIARWIDTTICTVIIVALMVFIVVGFIVVIMLWHQQRDNNGPFEYLLHEVTKT